MSLFGAAGDGSTPANPGLTNCSMLLFAGLMTSIALLLRSAKKYLLRTGSNQLMSKEKKGLAALEPGTCMTVLSVNTSSGPGFGCSPLQAVPARARTAAI